MDFLTMKSLHIISVVSWFSALFYLVRLFVYHKEAEGKPEAEKLILTAQLSIMEKRLWSGIAMPAMILTVFTGVYLLWDLGFPFKGNPWLHLKLTLVLVLLHYHFKCNSVRKRLEKGTEKWSSSRLRIFNEGATILLSGIVFSVVLKDLLPALLAWGIFTAIIVILMIIFKVISRQQIQ